MPDEPNTEHIIVTIIDIWDDIFPFLTKRSFATYRLFGMEGDY